MQLGGLWGYLAAAYETPAFRNSCPPDDEIVEHWQSKPECPKTKRLSTADAQPQYSFDVPAGVVPRPISQQ